MNNKAFAIDPVRSKMLEQAVFVKKNKETNGWTLEYHFPRLWQAIEKSHAFFAMTNYPEGKYTPNIIKSYKYDMKQKRKDQNLYFGLREGKNHTLCITTELDKNGTVVQANASLCSDVNVELLTTERVNNFLSTERSHNLNAQEESITTLFTNLFEKKMGKKTTSFLSISKLIGRVIAEGVGLIAKKENLPVIYLKKQSDTDYGISKSFLTDPDKLPRDPVVYIDKPLRTFSTALNFLQFSRLLSGKNPLTKEQLDTYIKIENGREDIICLHPESLKIKENAISLSKDEDDRYLLNFYVLDYTQGWVYKQNTQSNEIEFNENPHKEISLNNSYKTAKIDYLNLDQDKIGFGNPNQKAIKFSFSFSSKETPNLVSIEYAEKQIIRQIKYSQFAKIKENIKQPEENTIKTTYFLGKENGMFRKKGLIGEQLNEYLLNLVDMGVRKFVDEAKPPLIYSTGGKKPDIFVSEKSSKRIKYQTPFKMPQADYNLLQMLYMFNQNTPLFSKETMKDVAQDIRNYKKKYVTENGKGISI